MSKWIDAAIMIVIAVMTFALIVAVFELGKSCGSS